MRVARAHTPWFRGQEPEIGDVPLKDILLRVNMCVSPCEPKNICSIFQISALVEPKLLWVCMDRSESQHSDDKAQNQPSLSQGEKL